ncbi:hypothetical protein PSAB6_160043 [Paraburkholderia sabiae]|nr:hypothetical protein PSAB6_160043 [Paraburkholderia sabiae]
MVCHNRVLLSKRFELNEEALPWACGKACECLDACFAARFLEQCYAAARKEKALKLRISVTT